jgi:hypothetical protein
LDLSRRRLDVCLLSDHAEVLEQTAAPPDADGWRGLVGRVARYRQPVRAVIESMNGARFVHDTTGRATLLGTGYGALVGLLWGLLFAALFTFDSGSFWVVVSFSILVGGVGGAVIGAISHSSRGGERDFASDAQTRADHYEVQDGYADEAKRVLSTMPATA